MQYFFKKFFKESPFLVDRSIYVVFPLSSANFQIRLPIKIQRILTLNLTGLLWFCIIVHFEAKIDTKMPSWQYIGWKPLDTLLWFMFSLSNLNSIDEVREADFSRSPRYYIFSNQNFFELFLLKIVSFSYSNWELGSTNLFQIYLRFFCFVWNW